MCSISFVIQFAIIVTIPLTLLQNVKSIALRSVTTGSLNASGYLVLPAPNAPVSFVVDGSRRWRQLSSIVAIVVTSYHAYMT